MKITDVRWPPAFIPIEAPWRYAFGALPGFSRIVVGVHTDERLVGLDECYGGISHARLAGQVCEALGVDVGRHSGAEFGISQAALLQLAAMLPNLVHAADSHYHHLRHAIIEGGKLKCQDGKLDRDKLAKYHELSKKKQMGSWIEDPRRPGAVTYQRKW